MGFFLFQACKENVNFDITVEWVWQILEVWFNIQTYSIFVTEMAQIHVKLNNR